MSDSAQLQQGDWSTLVGRLLMSGDVIGWQRVVSSEQARVFYSSSLNVYCKIFINFKIRDTLRAMVFPYFSRSNQFIRHNRRLVDSQFSAPRVVASGTVNRHGWVATEGLPGIGLGYLLATYLRGREIPRSLLRWKWQLMSALGREVARLHNAGIYHGDLRPNNILVDLKPVANFGFIDNERNKDGFQVLSNRLQIKNLVQLNMVWPEDLSASCRLRFMRAYAMERGEAIDLKKMVMKVSVLTQQRLRGKAKGGYALLDPGQYQSQVDKLVEMLQ
ncbi:hypothetical protein NBRC116494_29830 [Aurantivibrio plasticivorans]